MAALTLANVGVSYRVRDRGRQPNLSIVKKFGTGGILRSARKAIDVVALDDVNIQLRDGDRLGLLGHNGAGKTTLLKVMSGILPPMTGSVRIEGHLSPLLSIQLGLNNQATGYENIFVRARYMGIPERIIRAQAEEIATFSELGDYMNLPISTYSSGMRLRLAFAIATAFSPDILVLDEWLSAGDAKFQSKAAKRLHDLIDRTGIFVMASHNPNLIKRVCNVGVVLDQSRLVFSGPIDMAIETYKNLDLPPARNTVSPAALFTQRVSDLQTIRAALLAYYNDHGRYPSTDNVWIFNAEGQPQLGLPDLVPGYLDAVPRDPIGTWDIDDPQYCYISDGTGFKLLARKTGESEMVKAHPVVSADPKRQTGNNIWAYGFWTPDYVNR